MSFPGSSSAPVSTWDGLEPVWPCWAELFSARRVRERRWRKGKQTLVTFYCWTLDIFSCSSLGMLLLWESVWLCISCFAAVIMEMHHRRCTRPQPNQNQTPKLTSKCKLCALDGPHNVITTRSCSTVCIHLILRPAFCVFLSFFLTCVWKKILNLKEITKIYRLYWSI